jgi:hypothetical protein
VRRFAERKEKAVVAVLVSVLRKMIGQVNQLSKYDGIDQRESDVDRGK